MDHEEKLSLAFLTGLRLEKRHYQWSPAKVYFSFNDYSGHRRQERIGYMSRIPTLWSGAHIHIRRAFRAVYYIT